MEETTERGTMKIILDSENHLWLFDARGLTEWRGGPFFDPVEVSYVAYPLRPMGPWWATSAYNGARPLPDFSWKNWRSGWEPDMTPAERLAEAQRAQREERRQVRRLRRSVWWSDVGVPLAIIALRLFQLAIIGLTIYFVSTAIVAWGTRVGAAADVIVRAGQPGGPLYVPHVDKPR